MSRTLTSLIIFLLLSPAFADDLVPSGTYSVVNSAGFVQQDGGRRPIAIDRSVGTATISAGQNDNLTVEINGTAFQLFPLKDGMANLEWDANGTALLHDSDIRSFLGDKPPKDIPVWGAELAWPGAGRVQLVLLPLGQNALTGFLISHPQDKTVVRQMELRQIFGPSGRPKFSATSGPEAGN